MTEPLNAPFLRGVHALITGSTSGIGLGIARALAKRGSALTLNGFGDEAEIAALCTELAGIAGAPVAHHPADMRDPDQIEAMMKEATAARGTVQVLVNNAGIQHVAPIAEFPVERWNDIIAVNLSSSFHTIRLALPAMVDSGWGRVINVASAHALRASPYKAAYVSAKHGVAGLTKTVALEAAEQNITVNAIAPGYVDTPLVTGQVEDTARARGITKEAVLRDVMLLAQPTKKLVGIDEVAELAVFLCSDAAASITGTVLPMDGGWSAK
jgi:3-hydroxybutyrate dehydrogenase